MKNERVDQKIVHFKKDIGRSHDAKRIGVELVDRYLEKIGHLNIEGGNKKSKTIAKLVL